MFVIRLIGGVGNQLFQYTFGQFLRHKFGVEVCYDIVAFDGRGCSRVYYRYTT